MGSYDFNGTSAHATNTVGAPATAYPVTFGVWFRPDVLTNAGCLASLPDKDNTVIMLAIEARGDDVGDPVRGRMGNNTVSSTTGFSATTWHSGVAVLDNGTQSVYIDGGSKGTGTFTTGIVGIDSISVGRHGDSSPSNFFDGRIGYVFVWNVALSDAQVASWHGGAIPGTPVAAYDFTTDGSGTIVDQYGTLNLTVSGATFDAANSPPVNYFGGGPSPVLLGNSAEADTAQALTRVKIVHL